MPSLRSINRFLGWIVVALALFILTAPFFPSITFHIGRLFDPTDGYRYQSNLASSVAIQDTGALEVKIPTGKVLVIPQIGVDAEILEGSSAAVLNQGLWRRPRSGTPEDGGNTVITGHRYLYTSGPNTFYALDKLRLGNRFLIFWNGKEYDYEVYDIRTVAPERVEIERNTNEPIVTLYTCTPLWSSKNRLVVRARPIRLPAAT